MISIFEHDNPEIFLRSYIHDMPKQGWGVSRKLATALKVNTSLISLVLTGRQHLSMEQAHGVAQFFGWGKLETKYFLSMIQKERAGTQDLKKFFITEMSALKKESLKLSQRLDNFKGLTEEQRTHFYSSWRYSAIRLFCSTDEKNGKSAEDIEKVFALPLAELRPMIDFLVGAGLLQAVEDRYQMGHQHTHLERGSPHLLKHQTNWRLKALQKSERLQEDEMMFTGPFSMSNEDFLKVREEIVQLIQWTVETMKASPAEAVVCLNIDWFRVL